jgi:drug/metabolite transporter (DMT)-like permease
MIAVAGERQEAGTRGGGITWRPLVADTVVAGGRDGMGGGDGRGPLLFTALGAASISASAVIVTLAGASAPATAFYRCALALPALAVLAAAERRRMGGRPRVERLRAAAAGVFLAIDLLLWTHAIADVGAGVATVLGNLQLPFVAAIAWVVLRERPHRAILMSLPVVMAGVVLVSGLAGPDQPGLRPAAGVWYGLGTSLAYAGFLLILRRSSTGRPHAAGPLLDATAGAAVTALVAGLVFGGLALRPVWPAIGWLLLLAMASQTAGWLLITSSLPRLPAAVSSLMLLLQPAAALALAAAVLGQRPTTLQLLGAVLTCGGAVAASMAATGRRGRQPRRTPGPARIRGATPPSRPRRRASASSPPARPARLPPPAVTGAGRPPNPFRRLTDRERPRGRATGRSPRACRSPPA